MQHLEVSSAVRHIYIYIYIYIYVIRRLKVKCGASGKLALQHGDSVALLQGAKYRAMA